MSDQDMIIIPREWARNYSALLEDRCEDEAALEVMRCADSQPQFVDQSPELARLNAEIRRLELLVFGSGFHGPVECPAPQPLQRWRLEAGDGGLYTDKDQEGEWVAWEDAERLNRHLHAANVALKARAETFDLQKSLIDKGKSLLAKCLSAVREQHCDDGEADFDLPAPLTIEIDKYLSPITGMDKRHDE